MSTPVAIGGIVAALALGFLGGVMAGGDRARPDRAVSVPVVERRDAVPAPPPVAVEDSVELVRKVHAQQERIVHLESQIAALDRKSVGVKTKEEKLAIAKEIFDAFIRASKNKSDPEETMKLLARLSELDEEMAPFFLAKYGEGKDTQMALMLAMASGGRQVADLIQGMLNDAATPADQRITLLSQLSGMGGLFSVKRIPVDGPLAETAVRLSRSTDTTDRQGGAGLLGGVHTPESRALLQGLAERDGEVQVRASAVRSLGYVGDRATLAFLRTFHASLGPELPAPVPNSDNQTLDYYYNAMLRNSTEAAIESLTKRFPD